MRYKITIDKKKLDDTLEGKLEITGDAIYYFSHEKEINGTKYKPFYTIFTTADYGSNWGRDPINREKCGVPHKIFISNNDAYNFSCKNAVIDFYQCWDADNQLKDWFLREESACTVAFDGKYNRGNKDMLKQAGVEIKKI